MSCENTRCPINEMGSRCGYAGLVRKEASYQKTRSWWQKLAATLQSTEREAGQPDAKQLRKQQREKVEATARGYIRSYCGRRNHALRNALEELARG